MVEDSPILTKREIGGALLTLLIQFYFSAHFEYIKENFFIRSTKSMEMN